MEKTDISTYFSPETLDSISRACKRQYEREGTVCSTRDLFLVLIQEEEITAILKQNGIEKNNLIDKVQSKPHISQPPFPVASGKVIFSPDMRSTLVRSFRIMKQTGSSHIGIVELFMSTLFDKYIESECGQDAQRIKKFFQQNKSNISFGDESSAQQKSPQSFLDDITSQIMQGRIEEFIDRDSELSQLIRILVRSGKNNVFLVGEHGVGKSTLVYKLAEKIIKNEVPDIIKGSIILEIKRSSLSSFLTKRNPSEIFDTILHELQNAENAIVYFRDVDLTTDPSQVEQVIFLQLLKMIVHSGEARCICSMNIADYRNLLSREATLSNLFEAIRIDEPRTHDTELILKQRAKDLMSHHGITIPDTLIGECILLSKRFLHESFLPSKAIDLLDESCSKAVLEGKHELDVNDLRVVISDKTGIPLEKLSASEQQKLMNLEDILNSKIIGQKEAVHSVSEVIRRGRVGLKDPKKPIGSFLFLGPSGVGKTYLAKNLAKIIYDDENALIRIDMSEFSESHTVQRLVGSPPGYIGYEEGGQLTNPVWERPYSLILLDEIEKAHPKVFDIFLQVLDEGRLTDGKGRTVDFKNTIIIATSNIASQEILSKSDRYKDLAGGEEHEQFIRQEIMPLLADYFRPEFINRFDEIVIFNPLGFEELKFIGRLQIESIEERLQDKHIRLDISDEQLQEFARQSFNKAFGARPLIRLLQEKVENVLAKKIISGEIKPGSTVHF